MARDYRNTDGNGNWFLNGDRNMFGDMNGIRTIVGNLYWNGNRTINSVGYMFLNSVGLWYSNWYFNMIRAIDWHRNWTINTYRHFYLDVFLNDHGIRFLDGYWVGLWHNHWHWTIDWHVYGHLNLFNDLVRLWNWHRYLNGHLNMFDYFVRLRYWHMDRYLNVFQYFVGLRHGNLDRYRSVDRHLHWHGNLLDNLIGLRHMDWHFNILFHMNGHLLDNFVGLRYGHFDFDWYMFVVYNGIWTIDSHWDRYTFGDCNSFMDIGHFADKKFGRSITAA